MEKQLAPSMLSADFNQLGEDLKRIEAGGARWLHVDVMDGMFVPSLSVGLPVIRSIRKESTLFFDTHLMIEEPIRYVEEFAQAGADLICFHLEAASDPAKTIEAIRATGKQVGISIKPKTPFAEVIPYLKDVDLLLIMSVEPGFGGQAYLPGSTEKIAEARAYFDGHGITARLEVDGGIKTGNVREVLDAGADTIVAGSAVFGDDTEGQTRAFQEILAAYA